MKARELITTKWPSMHGDPITWYQLDGAWIQADMMPSERKADALPYTAPMVQRWNERQEWLRVQSFEIKQAS